MSIETVYSEFAILLDALPRYGYRRRIAALAREEGEGMELEQAGASRVFFPFQDAADFAAREIAVEALARTVGVRRAAK